MNDHLTLYDQFEMITHQIKIAEHQIFSLPIVEMPCIFLRQFFAPDFEQFHLAQTWIA